jgi:hypothetical protein
MNQARIRLWSAAALGLMLGLAFGSRVPARGQETPPREPTILQGNQPSGPAVTVEHKGRLLVLTYGPTAASGVLSSNAGPRGEPPGFTIYKGQRKIASGQFEYG